MNESKIDTCLIENIPEHFMPAPDPTNRFTPMLQGVGTNTLAKTSTTKRSPKVDEITGVATINDGTSTIFIENYTNLKGGLRISTQKLLDAFTIQLTQQNSYKNNRNLNTTVIIPLKDYIQQCGVDLKEKPTNTPEEAEKEKKRIKALIDNNRKKIKQDLETLFNISMEWQESRGNDTKDFDRMRICDRVAIRSGNIILNFTLPMAEYLNNAYIMQYPLALLKVEERNPNSYRIGRKLALHNSIDNNQNKGTSDIISVKALLECAPDIITYDEVQNTDRGHWNERIRLPLERALDSLVADGVVSFWEYCNHSKECLLDSQLEIKSYEDFSNLFIHFQMNNAPDHVLRLQAKRQRTTRYKAKGAIQKRKKQ